MAETKVRRINAHLCNGYTVAFDMQESGDGNLILSTIKSCIISFTNLKEVEPHHFTADISVDKKQLPIEMWATTRKECISKLNSLNDCIATFTEEEING